MNDEETIVEEAAPDWCIDLDWYRDNDRSFAAMAGRCLCDSCRRRLKVEKGEPAPEKLLAAIGDCCSHEPGFIGANLPLMEGVFRVFLAGGNRPLSIEEISRRLAEQLGGSTYRASMEVLDRMLSSDRYYGIRPVSL